MSKVNEKKQFEGKRAALSLIAGLRFVKIDSSQGAGNVGRRSPSVALTLLPFGRRLGEYDPAKVWDPSRTERVQPR